MTNQIRGLRAILAPSEHQFGLALGKVLSPSQPLHSEEFLRGREEHWRASSAPSTSLGGTC